MTLTEAIRRLNAISASEKSLNESAGKDKPANKDDAIKEIKKIIKDYSKYITHDGDKVYLAHSGAVSKINKIAKEAGLSDKQVTKLITLKESIDLLFEKKLKLNEESESLGIFGQYYQEVNPEDIEGFDPDCIPSDLQSDEFSHVAWVEAKDEYYDALSNNNFEVLEIAQDLNNDEIVGLYIVYDGMYGPARVYTVSEEEIEESISEYEV